MDAMFNIKEFDKVGNELLRLTAVNLYGSKVSREVIESTLEIAKDVLEVNLRMRLDNVDKIIRDVEMQEEINNYCRPG